MRNLFIALVCLCVASGIGRGQPIGPGVQGAGIDQRLEQPVPLDLVFRDEAGKSVTLGEYFQDRPVILVLAYHRCPGLCSLVLNSLVETMRKLPLEPGSDYRVVVVSFDPKDTPEIAAAKKKAYALELGRPSAEAGWHFLTGDEEAIRRLTGAAGFRYFFDQNRGDYVHASAIMIVTPQGKLSRYFLGLAYPPRDVRLALVEAAEGKIGSRSDQLLLLCLSFDPTTGKYTLTALTIMRTGGVVTVLVLAVMLVWGWRRRAAPCARRSANGG